MTKSECINMILELSPNENVSRLWSKHKEELKDILVKYGEGQAVDETIKQLIKNGRCFKINKDTYVRIGTKCYEINLKDSIKFEDINGSYINKIYKSNGKVIFKKEHS